MPHNIRQGLRLDTKCQESFPPRILSVGPSRVVFSYCFLTLFSRAVFTPGRRVGTTWSGRISSATAGCGQPEYCHPLTILSTPLPAFSARPSSMNICCRVGLRQMLRPPSKYCCRETGIMPVFIKTRLSPTRPTTIRPCNAPVRSRLVHVSFIACSHPDGSYLPQGFPLREPSHKMQSMSASRTCVMGRRLFPTHPVFHHEGEDDERGAVRDGKAVRIGARDLRQGIPGRITRMKRGDGAV